MEQDPKFIARSTLNKTIGVPLCAVAVSRAFHVNANGDNLLTKKRQHANSGGKLPMVDITASEGESLSDIGFLFTDDEDPLPVKETFQEKRVVL